MATFTAANIAASAASWANRKPVYKDMKPVAKACSFTPSIQQKEFFDWIVDGDGSVILEAFAGAGKTSTLIEGLKLMQGRVFFGAYNKKIVEELQARVTNNPNVKIATLHSVGFGYLKQIAPEANLDYNKMRDIYRAIAGYDKQLKGHEAAVLNLVAFAKQAAIGIICPIDDEDAWYEQIDYYNVDCNGEPEIVIFNAIRTLKRSNDLCVEKIDFEDMIYYPLLKKAVKPTYDWVLGDELQDFNATRRLMARAMLKDNGRFVGVGDKNQAIYSFSGADHNSMDLMQSAMGASTLPLSVSFRCPKLVIAEAQKYVPAIEASPTAPDGIVRYASFDNIFSEAKVGDAILCRFNAPIVELTYGFILKGIPAKIEGKDIGANLKTLANKWKSPTNFADYRKRLTEYCEKNVKKFAEDKKEYLAEALKDRVSCLEVIISRVQAKGVTGLPSVLLCAEIDAIFGECNGDSSNYVLLSSIHKSKGLEWKKVIALTNEPGKRKLQEWEVISELNLKYVQITRSMSELVFIPLPKMGKSNMGHISANIAYDSQD